MGASKADEYIAAYRASDSVGEESELMERLDLLGGSSDAAAAAIMEDGGSAVGIHRGRFPWAAAKLTALQATTSDGTRQFSATPVAFNSQPKLGPVKVGRRDKAPSR